MAKDKTRSAIMEVAAKLFGKYGFHKTSMDEIAKIARKAKGSLYYHFKNKEELFTAVVDAELENLKALLLLIVNDDTLAADQKMKQYLLKRMEVLNASANYQETLTADFFERFDFLSQLRTNLDNWERVQIKRIIQQGINENRFIDLSDKIDMILDVFIMVQKGLEIPFFLQGKYDKYSPHFDDMLNILIKGLAK
jgi:AcrR family transcriptional regulator